ncbi:RICIN domain-containing protein [Myceligenerans indicum]|uniref:Ricin B lectin domain-containing protein n=1 Tax=Myceligenerans indicum TaxID=2593663 RepID=A0ABS1LPC2_9MICO|nr:RICIN domain-containing protein [Myceligenerans indicum]MBL0887402.1 hypothetical protein [Myceligenerans indicum]
MHDAGPPARAGVASLITWVLAALLVIGALLGLAWLFTQDLSPDPGASPTPAGNSAEPVAGGSPEASASASPDAEPGASPSALPGEAPSPEPPVVALTGAGSGRCLDVPGGNLADGATLQIFDCNGSSAQRWTITAAGELRVGGAKCLDDASGGADGTPVTIQECHGGDTQRWSAPGDGSVRSVATGLCLDVEGAATENGSRVNVYRCHLGDNQLWTIG